MRRKAGVWIATAAALAGGALAATAVFGAGAGGPTAVKRTDVLHLQVRPERRATLSKASAKNRRPSTLYLETKKPATIRPGTFTVAVRCPRRYHVTSGSAAALLGSQAQFLTIDGSGPVTNNHGVGNGWFTDITNTNTVSVKALGFLVCQRNR